MSTNLSKLIFFDFEVFKYDWLAVFNCDNHEVIVMNDSDELEKFVTGHSDYYFVGFNNYHYDDVICHRIIDGDNPYEINNQIINEHKKLKVNHYLYKSLDLKQDLKNISLKKIMGNLGLNIVECPINFNLDRKLSSDELKIVAEYCKNDVNATKYLFKYRRNYFLTKLGIIKDFKLPYLCIRYSENQLALELLGSKQYKKVRDELRIDFCDDLNLEIIPEEVLEFYGNLEFDYLNAQSYKELKKTFKYDLFGCPTTYGLGGIHSALDNYYEEGPILQIDFSSFYPTIMINYDYFSRGIKDKEKYKKIYSDRIELKSKDVEKSNRFKLILNKPYGCMKNPGHVIEDRKNCNNITINGQLIITQLICELQDYITLLQTNTDSITFKYHEKDYLLIKSKIDDFKNRFNLGYSELKIKKLFQLNVNSYITVDVENNIKCKGPLFKNYNDIEGTGLVCRRFDPDKHKSFNTDIIINNSLSIVDKCQVNYLVYGKPVEKTIQECYDNDEIDRFQLVVNKGNKFKECYARVDGEDVIQQNVCRVFAVKDDTYGGIYKRGRILSKDEIDWDYDVKIPDSFKHSYVFNDDLDKFDKSLLDLDYYIHFCKTKMYEVRSEED